MAESASSEKKSFWSRLAENRKKILKSAGIIMAVTAFCAVGIWLRNMPTVESEPLPESSAVSSETVSPESSQEVEDKVTSLPVNHKASARKHHIFPDGMIIGGVDVSKKTVDQAQRALDEWLSQYQVTLTVNGISHSYSAERLGLTYCPLDLQSLIDQAWISPEYMKVDVENPAVVDENALRELIDSFGGAFTAGKNARLYYDSAAGSFTLQKEEKGSRFEMDSVLPLLKDAVFAMESSVAVKVPEKEVDASVTAGSTQAQSALQKANSLLETKLSYVYAPTGKAPVTETISRSQIASFLTVSGDGLSLSINSNSLRDYCSKMGTLHAAPKEASSGVTPTSVTKAPGEYVDEDALYRDISSCVLSGTSGERKAVYYEQEENTSTAYGGNYIEVNLSAQHMWAYKNGKCFVDTDIVSGCVAWGAATPTGVYSIYYMKRNATLVGPGYATPVNYWMAFNGGIGIHDSLWRGAYGGDIYLTDGSHGCINTPFDAVATIYENVSVGWKVIVYGDSSAIEQKITGTNEYKTLAGEKAFALDAKPKYETALSYTSSDPAVAEVDSKGNVTPKSPGKATITVKTAKRNGFTTASMEVTVTVEAACTKNGVHNWDEGKVTTAATCQKAGVRTFTCKDCKETKTEAIPVLEHSWDAGKITTAASCEKAGTKTFTCKNCKETKTEAIPALEHSWDAGKITTVASCEKAGVKTYTCSKCGQTKTETVPALEHSWDEGKTTTAATCEKAGVKTYTCSKCGKTKTETIPVLDHDWNEGEVTTAATCGASGVKTITCKGCGKTKLETIPASGHDWNEGEITTPAACDQPGVRTYTCRKCGETKTESIPASGHTFTDGVCSICGEPDPDYSSSSETIPSTDPSSETESSGGENHSDSGDDTAHQP